ncbi:MAG: type IV pilin protein [Granulosicoccaceae bacterium]|jgi:type IV pilus assembly protein PilE
MSVKQRGFTLLELMIALAILAIIVSVAIPSYQDQIRKARRADGRGALLDAAQALERCNTINGSYNHASCGNNVVPSDSLDNHYAIAITAITPSSFTLSATAQGTQAEDTNCATLTLTNTGVKTPDPATDTNRCWE